MTRMIGIVVMAGMLSACVTTQYSSPEKIEMALNHKTDKLQQYTLGPADVVSVSVWRNPDLSISVPVRPDGKISVPLVGDVQASGKTPEQLATDVKGELKAFVREPQVSVVVTQMKSHEFLSRVRVTGAVGRSVSLPYREGMTVLDVVLTAGGPNNFAKAQQSVLYRQVGNETIAIPVNIDAILLQGSIETNYALQPGDILTVPEKTL